MARKFDKLYRIRSKNGEYYMNSVTRTPYDFPSYSSAYTFLVSNVSTYSTGGWRVVAFDVVEHVSPLRDKLCEFVHLIGQASTDNQFDNVINNMMMYLEEWKDGN